MGHVDFYPNGGRDQPGCSLADTPAVGISDIYNLEGAADQVGRHLLSCSHTRAIDLYIESLRADNDGCVSSVVLWFMENKISMLSSNVPRVKNIEASGAETNITRTSAVSGASLSATSAPATRTFYWETASSVEAAVVRGWATSPRRTRTGWTNPAARMSGFI